MKEILFKILGSIYLKYKIKYMARSLKKGFYVNPKILKKIRKMEEKGEKKVIKVWDRKCTIIPEMVGYTFAVHNGKEFVSVYVVEEMIGYRLGDFVPTKVFR
jgi:small subunit ribosomal protein S19